MRIEDDTPELALLAETFLLQSVPQAELRAIVADVRCMRESFPKGADIYNPTRFRRCLGILLSGRARVSKDALVLSVLEQGDLFGAAALFHQRESYETTITAVTTCSVLFLPQAQVEQLLHENRTVCDNYIRYLSGRIHFLSQRIEALTAPGAVGKLACLLLEEGDITCSATELARRLDVGRASLYRAFDALEACGAMRRRGKVLQVLQRDALHAYTGVWDSPGKGTLGGVDDR